MGDGSDYRRVLMSAVKDSISAARQIESQANEGKAQGAWIAHNNRMLADAAAITASMRTPLENYQQQVARLTTHFQAGAISQETYTATMKQAKEALDAAGPSAEKLGGTLSQVGGSIAMVGGAITAAFGAMALKSLQSAGKFEQTFIAFETMLGGAEEAQKTLDDLTRFAAETPFEMPEIEAAARGLVTFGERGDELMETLELIGNAAAGTSSSFAMVALIFNQIRGTGKLLTQDFRQLSTRGILSLDDLAKHLKVTTSEAQKMMSEGKISFEMVKEIFKGMSAEGGRFENLMKKQSQSLLGLWSTLKDDMGIAFRQIGEALAPVAKMIVAKLLELTSWFRGLSPEIKAVIGMVIGLAAVAGTLAVSFGGFLLVAGQTMIALGGLKVAMGVATMGAAAMQVAMVAAKVGAVSLAIAGIGFLAAKIYAAMPSIRAFNKEMDRAGKLNNALIEAQGKDQTAVLGKAGGMIASPEKRDFLSESLKAAEKNVEGTTWQLKMQEKQVKELEPTWRSLGQSGKKVWEAASAELENTRLRLEQNKQYVKDLKTELESVDASGKKVATADELEDAKKMIEALKEEAATLGLSDEEAKVYKMSLQGLPRELMAVAQAESERIKIGKESLKALEAQQSAYKKMNEGVREYNRNLQFQIRTFGETGRALEILKMQREGASAADIADIKRSHTTLKRLENHNKLLESGRHLIEQFATPQEKFNKTLGDLNNILRVTGPSFEKTYKKAIAEAEKELESANLEAVLKFRVEGNELVREGSAEHLRMKAALEQENILRARSLKTEADNAQPTPAELKRAEHDLNSLGNDNHETTVGLLERIAEAVEESKAPIELDSAGLV